MLFDSNYRDVDFEIPFVSFKISKKIVSLVAAGAFLIAGLWGVIFCFRDLFRWGMYASFFKLMLFNLLEFVFAGLIIFDKKNIIFPAGKLVALLFSGFSAFLGLFGQMSFIYWLNNRFAIALADLLLLAMLVITMFDYFEKYRDVVRKFWFAPPAVLLLSNLIFFFVTVRSFRWNWTAYVENLFAFIGVAAFSLWVANTEYAPLYVGGKDVWETVCEKFAAFKQKAKQPKPQNPQQQEFQVPYQGQGAPIQGGYAVQNDVSTQGGAPSQEFQVPYQNPAAASNAKPAGFIDMAMHILLLFVTCGIWSIIWNYKTTEHLNGYCRSMPQKTAAVELLLCMFVPFYIYIWAYQAGKRIDAMAAEYGIASDLATIGLILYIVCPIVTPILYQSKINEIAQKRGF